MHLNASQNLPFFPLFCRFHRQKFESRDASARQRRRIDRKRAVTVELKRFVLRTNAAAAHVDVGLGWCDTVVGDNREQEAQNGAFNGLMLISVAGCLCSFLQTFSGERRVGGWGGSFNFSHPGFQLSPVRFNVRKSWSKGLILCHHDS